MTDGNVSRRYPLSSSAMLGVLDELRADLEPVPGWTHTVAAITKPGCVCWACKAVFQLLCFNFFWQSCAGYGGIDVSHAPGTHWLKALIWKENIYIYIGVCSEAQSMEYRPRHAVTWYPSLSLHSFPIEKGLKTLTLKTLEGDILCKIEFCWVPPNPLSESIDN